MSTKGPQHILITGGGGGIGRATALRLALEGANLTIVDINSAACSETAAQVRKAGSQAREATIDVRRSAAVAGAVKDAVGALGPLTGCFNNAGIQGPGALIEDYPEDSFQSVLEINVVGVFNVLKHVIPELLLSGGGAIVNTASAAGLRTYSHVAGYCASKFAVVGLTGVAARENAARGIRVNAICPGPVDTEMIRGVERNINPNDPAGARRDMQATIPDGRYGRPEEVAELVAFLLSDRAKHINGATFRIDGAELA